MTGKSLGQYFFVAYIFNTFDSKHINMSDRKMKTIIIGYYLLPYMGGKSRIGKFIMDYIPTDTKIYVEVFGGMFWVYFNLDLDKYDKLEKVVYNDFNPLNANLFRCVRNHERFRDELKDYIKEYQKRFGPNVFKEFQQEIFSPDFKINSRTNDYETAFKYAYVLTQVYSGANPEKATYVRKHKNDTQNKLVLGPLKNKLDNQKWKNHFDKITDTKKMDFEDLIKQYDSPNTFFYCDPPYYGKEHYYSNHEFGLDSHERLADCLKKIKGKFALSYYDFDKLSQWFPKDKFNWQQKDFTKASGGSKSKGTEILIMNYTKAKKKRK